MTEMALPDGRVNQVEVKLDDWLMPLDDSAPHGSRLRPAMRGRLTRYLKSSPCRDTPSLKAVRERPKQLPKQLTEQLAEKGQSRAATYRRVTV